MKPYQLVNSCKGGINHCMIDITVTPINNQYKLIVQYNKKSANELRGEEKSFAEKFSKETYIGLKFVHSNERTFQNGIFSSISDLSLHEINYLLTTLLCIASDLNENAAVYYEKIDITDSYKNYGFSPLSY